MVIGERTRAPGSALLWADSPRSLRRKSGFSLSCCLVWAKEHLLPRLHLPSRKNLHIASEMGLR